MTISRKFGKHTKGEMLLCDERFVEADNAPNIKPSQWKLAAKRSNGLYKYLCTTKGTGRCKCKINQIKLS